MRVRAQLMESFIPVTRVISVVTLLTLNFVIYANDLQKLKESHEARLENSLKALSGERETVRQSILPLSESIRALKQEEKSWRKKLEKLQSVQDSKTVGLDDLKKEVQAEESERSHLEDVLLREFIADQKSSLPAYDTRREEMRKLDLSIESGELNKNKSLQAQLKMVEKLLDDLKKNMGGKQLVGKVLDQSGNWIEGEIVDLGPEQFFLSPNSVGRLEETENGQPQILMIDQEQLKSWKTGRTKNLPLDVSGGDAIKVAKIDTGYLEHIKKGGVWVYPIVLFALLAAITALFKSLILYSIKVSLPKVGHDLAKLVRGNQLEEAHVLARQQPRSCRVMWKDVIERGEGHAELSEEIMSEAMMEAQPNFEKYLSFIAITAAIAPLLGLLGTVTGIIKTFQMMEVFGAGDPKPLIGGISEALITTEIGLILAIPALLFHALLSRRAQSLLAKMERAMVAFSNGLMNHDLKSSQKSAG